MLADASTCAVRGCTATPDNPLTLGHRLARANGGTLSLENLQPECARCNHTRGATPAG